MPALLPTDFYATVVWLGRVMDRSSALAAESAERLTLGFEGPEGEAHGGTTRPSCSRLSAQYRPGTEIRNVRQLTIVSEEEMAATAAKMGLPRLEPEWVGASIMIRGLPDFTHVPPSSRLQVERSGAAVVIDMENRPCVYPGKLIETIHPGHGKGYRSAAQGKRGVTAWVECPGDIAVGDRMRLHIPDQRPWAEVRQAELFA